MTKSQLPGPGLTDEQWDRLKAIATSLTPDQSNWVGGYFTGYADAARIGGAVQPPVEASAPAASTQRTLTILHGGETGNGAAMAEAVAKQAATLGLAATTADLAAYKPSALKQEQDLLLISSTHGEGEPPQPAQGFFEFLDSRKASRLDGVRFAVMALGDSTYEFYCEAGKRLDRRLEELGAERIAPRIDCDVDQLALGKNWAGTVLQGLVQTAAPVAAVSAAPATGPVLQSFDQANPYQAEVLENLVLTGRGSSKQTRHLELSLSESGLHYEPGDTLGIVLQNDPRVVAELLDCLALDPAASLTVDGQPSNLGDALATGFEIATATPRFLTHWATLSGASALADLAGPDKAAERVAYLEAHHVVDIARLYPVAGLTPETLVAGLRALQPRFYSIASSQAAQDGDVHLTVSTVRYELHGSERFGVVSG
ncbi:MAG TPA: sulfite reductase flavoprotein subunit alpha, partial [Devosia sp.]|nr:sulfite reductase flavoprotein subunit alpha [Devosia sp.]